MEQQLEALKIALLQDDDKAGQAAAVAVLCSVALLLDRGVRALETIALNTVPEQ